MNQAIIIIGDIEGSRELKKKGREEVQEKLQKILDEINKGASGLASPYTVTLGDEFQAVYSRADELFTHCWKILSTVHPVKVRFSVGVGEIVTPINEEQAIGMDGPAFHAARDGIDRLKESGFLMQIGYEENSDTTLLKILNGTLHLLSREVRNWNKNRITMLHMLKEGLDYKEISSGLGLSQAAFYKNKEAGMLDEIIELTDNMAEMLNSWISS